MADPESSESLDGLAELDLARAARRGYPEAIYCEGKSPEQVRAIAARLAAAYAEGRPRRGAVHPRRGGPRGCGARGVPRRLARRDRATARLAAQPAGSVRGSRGDPLRRYVRPAGGPRGPAHRHVPRAGDRAGRRHRRGGAAPGACPSRADRPGRRRGRGGRDGRGAGQRRRGPGRRSCRRGAHVGGLWGGVRRTGAAAVDAQRVRARGSGSSTSTTGTAPVTLRRRSRPAEGRSAHSVGRMPFGSVAPGQAAGRRPPRRLAPGRPGPARRAHRLLP